METFPWALVLLVALQIVAVATTVTAWVPQALVGLRKNSVHGVSRSSWLIAAGLGATWSIYGFLNEVWLLAFSEGVFAVGSTVVLCTLVSARKAVVGVTAAVLLGVLLVVSLPAVSFSVAGVLASLSVRVAQLARLFKYRDASGVADSSWWLLTVALACWGVFGIVEGKQALAVGSLLGVASSVAVVAISAYMRKKAKSASW